jgi:long-chain acyl-CoA synthetase
LSEATPNTSTETTQRPLSPSATIAEVAREDPARPAIFSPHGDRTFAELDARVNRLAHVFRERGLRAGDAIALVCSNRPEFAETLLAGLRFGLRVTPIKWLVGAEEMSYILRDCEAKAFGADARFADVCAAAAAEAPDASVRLAVGGEISGFASYEDALAAQSSEPIDDESPGGTMLYTSGTTGRPKGVYRPPGVPRQATEVIARALGYEPGKDMHLCTGPLYHAAPLAFSLSVPIARGVGVVVMDGWDAEEALRLIEQHRVTHTHMVPTMFHRLISLPEDVRARYDLSSLRNILHGAAPCPVDVKRALIEWVGPIVYEYYAATEGWGALITSQDWLRKPGSVGRPREEGVQIRDGEGNVLPAGEIGTVYLRAPEVGRFEYYKDADKTASTYSGDYFTLGDMGYLDEDGYLFLTDRTADLIISGGVNIYPAEVDAVLLTHPAVGDSCTIGIPNPEWGEEVKSVIELRTGVEASEELAQELIEHCRERLASFKCPRSIDFTDELPRHDTGKLYRRLVRERYRQQAGG